MKLYEAWSNFKEAGAEAKEGRQFFLELKKQYDLDNELWLSFFNRKEAHIEKAWAKKSSDFHVCHASFTLYEKKQEQAAISQEKKRRIALF